MLDEVYDLIVKDNICDDNKLRDFLVDTFGYTEQLAVKIIREARKCGVASLMVGTQSECLDGHKKLLAMGVYTYVKRI